MDAIPKSRKNKIAIPVVALLFLASIAASAFLAFPVVIPMAIFAAASIWLAIFLFRRQSRTVNVLCALAILLFLIFPGKSDLRSFTYTKYLFTAEYSGPFTFRTIDDSLLKDGENFRQWRRFHFGFPLDATTVDISTEGRGMLGVIEPMHLLLNAFFGLTVVLLTSGLMKLFSFVRRRYSRRLN